MAASAVSTARGAAGPSSPPSLAQELFGDRLPLVVRYAQWLGGAGVERGLIGPRETERLWQRHILNCVAIAPLIDSGSTVVDIGSGAGLPGLVLALARPDLDLVLVESMSRRTTFLDDVITDLELSRVSVRRARAEDLRGAGLQADVVTARALAPMDRLVRWATPLLAPSGVVLAIKGDGAVDEVTQAWPMLNRSGYTEAVLWAVFARTAGIVVPGSPGALEVVETLRWSSGASAGSAMAPGGTPGSAGAVGADLVDAAPLARVVSLHRRPVGLDDRRTSSVEVV